MDLYDQLERKDSTNWLRSLKLLGVIARESNDSDLMRSATVAMVNLLEIMSEPTLSTLPLDVEMVVLSACETSLGKVVPGESVMSLGSAFAAAGARSTLTSLWKVDDAATEDLMIGFYEALAAGETRAEALAQAQNLQRENGNYAHPYYWSAMTLTGEAGVLPIEKRSGWWMWLIGGLIVLCGLVLLLRKN
jgi:CHAT domain-containing protein